MWCVGIKNSLNFFSFQTTLLSINTRLNCMLAKSIFSLKKCKNLPVRLSEDWKAKSEILLPASTTYCMP